MQATKLSLALLLAGLAAHAHAAGPVIVDTYGPDFPFGWPTQLKDSQQRIAVAFDITSVTTIESILSSIDGIGGVTVGVLSRQGAVPIDPNWLYSTHLVDPWADTAFAPSGWTLAAGSYWLAAVADAGFTGQWQSGTETPNAAWAYTNSAGTWQAATSLDTGAPALRITALTAAVPEPATYGLMALGALVVGIAARRKQQQG